MTSGHLDSRFSSPESATPPYDEVERLIAEAELYWLSTVRADGRPHVAPLVGVWHDGTFCFCTGEDEQKFRNLAHSPQVAVTTGSNAWSAGIDVVVEGAAQRVTGRPALDALAEAWCAKYGEDWRWAVSDDDRFVGSDPAEDERGGGAVLFRVRPAKVIAFAKDPHGQTTYRP